MGGDALYTGDSEGDVGWSRLYSGGTREYAAFISYRHSTLDAGVARKVQRAIESYRLPASVVSRGSSPASSSDRSLGKCFRDEDELAASSSLPEKIYDALARSRFLIVICTPQTSESPWVKQEIATFTELHGRERIIHVLADGSSSECLSGLIDENPSPSRVESPHGDHPLAADLRPDSRAQQKIELLRIIATVAQCDFDDLRRRDLQRRRRRSVIVGALGAAVVIVIAILIVSLNQTSQDALAASSRDLVAQSHEALNQGDRLEAVRLALEALPSSSAASDRPFVPEAQQALADALGLQTDLTTLWKPNFTYNAETNIVAMASDIDGGWVAVLDENGIITVLDMFTSATLSTFDIRDFIDLPKQETLNPNDWIIESAGRDRLLVACRQTTSGVASLNPLGGAVCWKSAEAPVTALAVERDLGICGIFTINDDGSVAMSVIDASDGSTLASMKTEAMGAIRPNVAPPASLDLNDATACLGLGRYALAFFFQEGTYQLFDFDNSQVSSLVAADGMLVDASSDRNQSASGAERYLAMPFTFTARSLDETADTPLWRADGQFDASVSGDPFDSVAYLGLPRIIGPIAEGTPAVTLTAGQHLQVRSLDAGNLIYEEDFPTAIVNAGTLYGGPDSDYLVIALADGTLDVRLPTAPAAIQGDTLSTALPTPIDEAFIDQHENGEVVVLARSSSEPTRLLSYSLDVVGDDAPEDLSLDEMLAMAHQLLDEANRSSLPNE